MFFTHLVLILHRAGDLLVRRQWNVFSNSRLNAAMKEGMSNEIFLNVWTASLSHIFTNIFIVSSSSVMGSVMLGEEE